MTSEEDIFGNFTPWPVSPSFCPHRPFPIVDDLVRLDQIARFPHLTDIEKKTYHDWAAHLWNMMSNFAEGSNNYAHAFQELLGLSLLLKKGMEDAEGGAGKPEEPPFELGAYVRACKHEAEERRLLELEVSRDRTRTHEDAVTRLRNQLSEFSFELRIQVNAFRLYIPRGISEKEMERWILETRVQYGQAITERMEAQRDIDDLAGERIQRQRQGNFLTEDELKLYDIRMSEATNRYNQAVMRICNLRLKSEEHLNKGGRVCSRQIWP